MSKELIEGLDERAKEYSKQFKSLDKPINTEKTRSSSERDFKEGYKQGFLKANQQKPTVTDEEINFISWKRASENLEKYADQKKYILGFKHCAKWMKQKLNNK